MKIESLHLPDHSNPSSRPAVGTPAVGTPAVGTPAVGTPAVGTPAVTFGTPSASVFGHGKPGSPKPDR
jgi:hypothetical protein